MTKEKSATKEKTKPAKPTREPPDLLALIERAIRNDEAGHRCDHAISTAFWRDADECSIACVLVGIYEAAEMRGCSRAAKEFRALQRAQLGAG